MHSTSEITMVIADDHAVVRKGLQAFFAVSADIRIVGSAGTGAEAVRVLKEQTPHVVLLDLFMPDQPAEVTIRQMKEVCPETQIVLLTSHEGSEYIAEVMRAGALSYILKDISPEALVQTVRKAAEGEKMLDSRLAKSLMEELAGAPSRLHDSLSDREKEVLQLIAQGQSNAEIAETMCISEKTVKSHVSSILSKLYLADRTKVAVYAWREGLVKGA